MGHRIKFTCDECANTTFVTRYDEEGDLLIECLACGEFEVIAANETEIKAARICERSEDR